jgi:hypothetical protein
MKYRKLFFIISSVLIIINLYSIINAQNIDLTTSINNNVFYKGDNIKINLELINLENKNVDLKIIMNIESNNGKNSYNSIEKDIALESIKTYIYTLNFTSDFVGEYDARVLLKNKNGFLIKENSIPFKVISKESEPLDLEIKTCKYSNCTFSSGDIDISYSETESNFIKGERVYVVTKISGDVELVGGYITPKNETYQLKFINGIAEFYPEDIGEYKIFTSIINNQGNNMDKNLYIELKEKKPNLFINLLYIILIVLIILMIVYILINLIKTVKK